MSNACTQVASNADYATQQDCSAICGLVGTVSGVDVSCDPSSVGTGGTSACTATVNGSGNYSQAVTWSTGFGTVDQSGNYSAPGTAGTASVIATSLQDPTQSGQTTVTVIGSSAGYDCVNNACTQVASNA